MRPTLTSYGLTAMVAKGCAYDHPLSPTFPHRDPAAMAWRLRGGRWRWAEPRYRGRRGAPGVHDQRGSRAFTALRLIDVVTASHSHMNELATLEFGLQQLARLEDELPPDGAVPGPLILALSSRTPIGTVERANGDAAGCGAATPHCDSDRDHDRLSSARRPMATALSRRVAGARVQRPGRL